MIVPRANENRQRLMKMSRGHPRRVTPALAEMRPGGHRQALAASQRAAAAWIGADAGRFVRMLAGTVLQYGEWRMERLGERWQRD